MSKEQNVIRLLNEHSIEIVGKVFLEPGTNTNHVFIKVTEEGPGKRKPSSYELKLVSDKALEGGLIINFILVGNEEKPVHEPTLKAAFTNQLYDRIRNVFVTSDGRDFVVWVEPKTSLTEDEEALAQSITEKYFELVAEKLDKVIFSSTSNFPTDYACLSQLRIKAPATAEELLQELRNRNFHVPDIKWMSSKLDKLRKNGRILRQKDSGRYVMTLSGLKALGSAKGRRSPDIARALDLARRGS